MGEGGTGASSTAFLLEKTTEWLPARLLTKPYGETEPFANPQEAVFPREFARIEVVFIFNEDTERFIPSHFLHSLDPNHSKHIPFLAREFAPTPSLPAASLIKHSQTLPRRAFLSGYIQTGPSPNPLAHLPPALHPPTVAKRHLPGANALQFEGRGRLGLGP